MWTASGPRTIAPWSTFDAIRTLPRARRPAARAAIERLLKLTRGGSFPQDVWIDGKRRVRRIELDYSLGVPSQSGDQRVELKLTEDLFAFGVPVRVSKPNPADTADLTERVSKQAAVAQPG
jgi:hypothetical protein